MTVEEKAAGFDLIVAAVTNRWHDDRWSINCTSMVDQPLHATAEECVSDLLAWAERVGKWQTQKRAKRIHPL